MKRLSEGRTFIKSCYVIFKKHLYALIFIPLISVASGKAPNFDLTITVNGGDYGYGLKIGFSAVASDKYDSGLDKYAPPPSPPGTFDAALGWNNDRWYTQIIYGDTSDLKEHIWDIQLQYPKNGIIKLSWENGCLAPLGSFILSDPFGGKLVNVDMTAVESLILDNPKFTTVKLKVVPRVYFSKSPPPGFEFTPIPISGTFIGTVTLNGKIPEECDWIGAFDERGNCAGGGHFIMNGGLAWVNIPIYADDVTTPNIDEGMNQEEDFVLKLWDASSGQVLELSKNFDCWSNQKGAPMPGCGGVGKAYDFVMDN